MSLWTVQQHEWLRALGHPVLLLAGDPALVASLPSRTSSAAPAAHPDVSDAGQHREGAVTTVAAPKPAHPQPSRMDDRTTSPNARRATPPEIPLAPSACSVEVGARPVGVPRADASAKKAALEAARGARRVAHPTPTPLPSDDPLLQAIARASGLDASAFESAARTWQIDLAQLRAKPLSKRTLWLQIRLKDRKTAR